MFGGAEMDVHSHDRQRVNLIKVLKEKDRKRHGTFTNSKASDFEV